MKLVTPPVHKGTREDGSVNCQTQFFSPGASRNKAKGGWLQNLNSLALDLVTQLTVSLITQVSRALGKTRDEQVDNLVTILDGYFEKQWTTR